jgi:flagella basal body P-ring formation protein FlgA
MKLKMLLIILLLVINTKQVHALQQQSVESINKAISLHISSSLPKGSDYKLTIGQFDNRLKLLLCNQPLEVFVRNKSLKSGRNSVGVKCNTKKKWTVYISVIIHLYKNVLVLSQSIRRGNIFSKSMFKEEKRDVSILRLGFIVDSLEIIGKQATRNLNFDTVLNKIHYREPKLVKRGDNVIISLKSHNLNISMDGIAVMDGIKGQKISVKNIKSQQIVQAIVEKQGQVVVIF